MQTINPDFRQHLEEEAEVVDEGLRDFTQPDIKGARFRNMAARLDRVSQAIFDFGKDSVELTKYIVQAVFRIVLGIVGGSVLLAVLIIIICCLLGAYKASSGIVQFLHSTFFLRGAP